MIVEKYGWGVFFVMFVVFSVFLIVIMFVLMNFKYLDVDMDDDECKLIDEGEVVYA